MKKEETFNSFPPGTFLEEVEKIPGREVWSGRSPSGRVGSIVTLPVGANRVEGYDPYSLERAAQRALRLRARIQNKRGE